MFALFRLMDSFLMRVAMIAAAVLLTMAACISLWQVVTRFVFEEPSTWSEVAARSLIIWMVYLGLAVAFRRGALMSVEYLYLRSRGRGRTLLICLIAAVSLGVLLVMGWTGYELAYRVRFQTLAGAINPFTGLGISITWLYASVPVGAALSIVGLAAHTAEQLGLTRQEDNT